MAQPIHHHPHSNSIHPPPRRLDGFHVPPTVISSNSISSHPNPISLSASHYSPTAHFFGSPPNHSAPSSLFTDAELIDSLINPPPGSHSHSSSPPQLARDQPFPFSLHHLDPSPSHHSLPRSSPLTHPAHAPALHPQSIYSPRSGPPSAGPTELFPDHAFQHGSFSSMAIDEPGPQAREGSQGPLSPSVAARAPMRIPERTPLAASVPTYLSSPAGAQRMGWQPQSMSGDPGRLVDKQSARTQDKFEEGSVCSSVQSYTYLQPRSAKEADSGVNQQKEVLSEKRRRRRESHNAVERRRRDNINDRIAELATLLPSCMLDAGGEVGGMMMVNEETEAGGTAETASENAAPGSAHCKPNKGIVLAKSVEYIKHLKELVELQVSRIQELEQQLEQKHSNFQSDRNRSGVDCNQQKESRELVKEESVGFFDQHRLHNSSNNGHQHGRFEHQQQNNQHMMMLNEDRLFCGNGNGDVHGHSSRIDPTGFGFF